MIDKVMKGGESARMINTIVERCPVAAIWEQLAEECTELAKSALKAGRIMRAENPTPMTLGLVMDSLAEEITDLIIVCDVLGLKPDKIIYFEKLQRWANRLSDKQESETK